jgi:hypothetical protein
MGATEPEEIEGVLLSASGPTRQEHARSSALFTAVDVAKQIPAASGETVESRMQTVLAVADQVYSWLLGPEPTDAAR